MITITNIIMIAINMMNMITLMVKKFTITNIIMNMIIMTTKLRKNILRSLKRRFFQSSGCLNNHCLTKRKKKRSNLLKLWKSKNSNNLKELPESLSELLKTWLCILTIQSSWLLEITLLMSFLESLSTWTSIRAWEKT